MALRAQVAAMLLLGVVALSLTPSVESAAQEISRDAYLLQVPLGQPRLVQQTEASAALALYGDPSAADYRDVAPIDGIDDRRHEILLALAVRFAPYLVQNTTNIPTDFRAYIHNRSSFPLFIDTWDVSEPTPRRTATRAINFSALGRAGCDPSGQGPALDGHPEATEDPALEDCKLLELMQRFTPGAGTFRRLDEDLVRGRPSLFDVLFFNFPGDGPRTWKQAYVPEFERTPPERRGGFPHAYVHPFLREVGSAGDAGYELILQYWFFYPTNDGGMDHEGDWEHLNVVVSPRSLVETPLSAETIGGILDGSLPATDDAPDPLIIKRLDHYFHNSVMELDFSNPNVYLPRDAWQAQVKGRRQLRFREREIWEHIRYLAYADDRETVVNTHAIGYIGSNNKGLNQALELPGGSNRDAHGTYPIPGRYNNVGPGGTTDQISRHVDSRRIIQGFREGSLARGPVFKAGSVLGLDDPARLLIVPDWERIVGPAREDPSVRAEWAWLLLPIHWGYPATKSPFSGIIEHYNTGNVAPIGPSYNGGWNASGAAPGFSLYDPHTLPELLPLQVQDNFRNDLGFLNLTVPVLLNLPPLDFLTRLAMYPFRRLLRSPDPVFYPSQSVPFRFIGLSSGLSYQILDTDFSGLVVNPQQFIAFRNSIILHLLVNPVDSTTMTVAADDYVRHAVGTFVQLPFYVGGRFTSENTVRNTRTSFGAAVAFNNIPDYTYSAQLNYWEYAGSIRYSLSTSRLQPFVKAGYGWAWYRLEDVKTSVGPLDPENSKWIGPRNVLPNVWHYGLGMEFVPWKRVGLNSGGLEMAVRVEYARYVQGLGLDLSRIPLSDLSTLFSTLDQLPKADRIHRNDFVLGVSVSF